MLFQCTYINVEEDTGGSVQSYAAISDTNLRSYRESTQYDGLSLSISLLYIKGMRYQSGVVGYTYTRVYISA